MSQGVNPSPGFQRNPGHPITVEPYDGVVTVSLGSTILASSKRAMLLREANYPPRLYIPFEDIYFEHLERIDKRTHCPFKGDATYWMATANGEAVNPAMWAYENPFDEMSAIRAHGAFYEDGVRVEAGGTRAGHDAATADEIAASMR